MDDWYYFSPCASWFYCQGITLKGVLMPIYAVGFSNFQCTLLLLVSVEVVPLGSLEGAIDNAASTVVVAFVAVVFCNTNILITAADNNDKGKWWHRFFQKVSKENTLYFTCRAFTYLKKFR